jgi:tyrosinase
MGLRKNQKDMLDPEWQALIAAIDALHGTDAEAPAYRRFVSTHVQAMDMNNMDWSVHTMRMGGTLVPGRNFLAWHRHLAAVLEARLQRVDPTVTLPYWDAITDQAIPAALDDDALLARWSVTRDWDPSQLADPSDLEAVQNYSGTFSGFQSALEINVHNGTHNAVGGDMAGAASPTDPLFWLHHAFIDKTWADWQASANNDNPPNGDEMLQPDEMQPGVPFGVTVASQLDIAALGYSYG